MKSEASVEIEKPIHKVFDFTTNNVAEWSTVVVEDEVIEAKPEVAGTRFRTVTKGQGNSGHTMDFQGVITHHKPPTQHVVHMTGQYFDIDAEYYFEDLGHATRVTQRSTVHPRGFYKLLFKILGPFMNKAGCRAAEEELENLKRAMEGGDSLIA